MAKKAAPAADTSLRQWLLTDRSTRRLRKQIKRAERREPLKELQGNDQAVRCRHTPAQDTPTAAAIVYAVLESTKWAGIVNDPGRLRRL